MLHLTLRPHSLRFNGLLCAALLLLAGGRLSAETPVVDGARAPDVAFLQNNCLDCHQGSKAEAGLDLASLPADLTDHAVEADWVRIYDRVRNGEMPPPDYATPDADDRAAFLSATARWIESVQQACDAEYGRVQGRRLTRREMERSLHDLLGIDIPLTHELPEDSTAADYSTMAEGQSISHFQLERHLAAVDLALDEAFRRLANDDQDDAYRREFDARGVARESPRRRCREPEMRQGLAVTWSSGLTFYGRLPATAAPEDGWYRFKLKISGVKLPETGGVWATVRSGLCTSSAPLLASVGAFEAEKKPKTVEFVAWLPRRHMLEVRPNDATLKRARFDGGQVGVGEGEPQNVPGIAIHELTMERIHRGPDNAGLRELLFSGVPFVRDSKGKYLYPKPRDRRADAERLLTEFASRAFRRPVTSEEVAPYVALAHAALANDGLFSQSVRLGMRAILCSPRFMYLTESPGQLDHHAVAARLSYMLTGSAPDAQLRELAAAGRLHDAQTLREQADRLLAGEGGRRFIEDFAAEWLDLDQIDFTQPDTKMFSDFDPVVQSAMVDETVTFLQTMLSENLGVAHLIESDFTFLNSRLARYYGIEGVEGDALRRVTLKTDHRRGGVLTQGAILKVTANGTNTSPVIRGVWISERLLGHEIGPPPDNVEAIEPDIRGAQTIREQLAKHREVDTCMSCHKMIDPPGFALENYDPAGRWRDQYVQLVRGKKQRGAKIDPSYAMADGRQFDNIDEFRALVVADSRRLATNVATQLVMYGTGGSISFADRAAIDEIVERAKMDEYGLRSIIHAVVTSGIFLSK